MNKSAKPGKNGHLSLVMATVSLTSIIGFTLMIGGKILSARVIIRNLIQEFLRQKQKQFNFAEVITPILGSKELYETSGHLGHYQDYMFPEISRDNENFYLRPMTCPHHCLIYQQKLRSYRDLPFRLCENSLLFRYEASGALKGLERAQTLLINSLQELELNYTIMKGEAAFYGPKLDIEVQAADGKNITLATIQLDFVLPQKFGLNYIDKEQKLKIPEEEVKKYCEKLEKKLNEIDLRVKIISPKKSLDYRIRQIHKKKIPYYLVLLVTDKEEKKIITRQEALAQAQELGLDLFCVAPTKSPPVCKLINYQKYIFELSKKKKDKKENICKEIRISFNIGKNDLKGAMVKVNLVMVGKEKAHPDLAQEKCQKIIEELKSQSPKIELKDNIRQHLGTLYFFLYRKRQ
ncbi:3857_t:CDS:2 [Gigaspora margarita]|uniref:threonine--tRNA ligase n=1 Tax=Gigaspora margarita TaxID=4874 RepID=A0ABN7V0W8_GIGMA|nr:3857_t:CDS:2 [Gigaspora margarita]